ncbi:MAG: anion permease [Candidatus Hodarchaeales archaeon]|jgi:PiT family inorganic phosphate transporter
MIDLLLVTFLLIAFILAIGVGANDETFAPVVGSRRLTSLQCVSIGAVLAFIGALTLGPNVAGTVGTGISDLILTEKMIFSVLLAMSIVLILSSYFGLPISSTHAMVGSIIGLTIFYTFDLSMINMDKIISIILSWFLSPLFGLIGSFFIFKVIDAILVKYTKGFSSLERNERIAANLLLIFVVITAISRGGNDVANAVSPLVQSFKNVDTLDLSIIPLIIGGIGMGVGLLLLARRVLKTLANEIVELTPSKSLAVQISTASITFIGANLGIPLSGTHILVSSFVGVALSSKSRVNNKVLGRIAISAVGTPFFGAILSIIVFIVVGTVWL